MKRELFEELGIMFEKATFFKKDYFEIKDNSFEDDVFIAQCEGNISDIKFGEGAGFAFFGKTELDSLNVSSETKRVLKEYIEECH